MWQLFIGSILLSLMHAAIPNHWIPLVALARSEHWSERRTVVITAVCGFSHTLSTIFIGLLVGFAGYQLSEKYEIITEIVAPTVLVLVGLVLLVLDFKGGHHHHDHGFSPAVDTARRSTFWLVVTLATAMLVSPCLEIEAYYLHAGAWGWAGIAIVSVTYLVLTVLGMVILVHFGLKGIRRFEWHFLEHHERLIAGSVLVLLGGLAFWFQQ